MRHPTNRHLLLSITYQVTDNLIVRSSYFEYLEPFFFFGWNLKKLSVFNENTIILVNSLNFLSQSRCYPFFLSIALEFPLSRLCTTWLVLQFILYRNSCLESEDFIYTHEWSCYRHHYVASNDASTRLLHSSLLSIIHCYRIEVSMRWLF